MKNLLAIDTNAKTVKGQAFGYTTAILYMAPHKAANGKTNLCADATEGCIKGCLYSAGRGAFSNVQTARINKAMDFLKDAKGFVNRLVNEIAKLSKKHGDKLVIRLNGTTDIPYENIKVGDKNIFQLFPTIQFYDYTKNPSRVLRNATQNYHLTFSRAETKLNIEASKNVLSNGGNVAIVFSEKLYNELVQAGTVLYNGKNINVVDGDENDLRFLDKQNSIIALKAKGKAKKDTSGFVVHTLEQL